LEEDEGVVGAHLKKKITHLKRKNKGNQKMKLPFQILTDF
jgi:hypothetical protein